MLLSDDDLISSAYGLTEVRIGNESVDPLLLSVGKVRRM
jgi:hypothetical protein